MPNAGELKDRVRFERRGKALDGYGNEDGAWAPLITSRRVRLRPQRGGEAVQADRLAGISAWELVVRFDADTAGITAGDRAVDARDESRTFNIRSALDLALAPWGPRRWIHMTLELEVAT